MYVALKAFSIIIGKKQETKNPLPVGQRVKCSGEIHPSKG